MIDGWEAERRRPNSGLREGVLQVEGAASTRQEMSEGSVLGQRKEGRQIGGRLEGELGCSESGGATRERETGWQ
jgi:hypothetical protein